MTGTRTHCAEPRIQLHRMRNDEASASVSAPGETAGGGAERNVRTQKRVALGRSPAVRPLVAERLRCDGSQLGHLTRHIDTIHDDATRYDGYLGIAVGALLVAFMARRVMRMTRVRTTEPTPGT